MEIERFRDIDSFVVPKNRELFQSTLIDEAEWVNGVYFNSPDNFIVFTTAGLHWVRGDTSEPIPFSAIQTADLPDDDFERVIQWTLHDETVIPLVVLNDTEE